MNPKRVRKAEQVELIMECRSSGIFDYQWCQNHGIHPRTFYNWVSKLRKVGYAIPDSQSRTSAVSVKQEVVKLEMSKSAVSIPAKIRIKVLLRELDGYVLLYKRLRSAALVFLRVWEERRWRSYDNAKTPGSVP